MTDKARKRRKDLAAKLNVSRRTAANIITAKRDKNRRVAPEPMQRDVLARTIGGSPPDAHNVYLKYDPTKGQTFGDAVVEARKEAVDRDDLLEVWIRRVDYPGHPFICSWSRRAQGEPWAFSWQSGAADRAAQPLTLEGVKGWANMTSQDLAQIPTSEFLTELGMAREALNRELRRPPAEIDTANVRARMLDLGVAQTSLVRRQSLSV
jgi:hypothetical protein